MTSSRSREDGASVCSAVEKLRENNAHLRLLRGEGREEEVEGRGRMIGGTGGGGGRK